MPEYNGEQVEIIDEESHHSEDMRKITNGDWEGWVFVEDLE